MKPPTYEQIYYKKKIPTGLVIGSPMRNIAKQITDTVKILFSLSLGLMSNAQEIIVSTTRHCNNSLDNYMKIKHTDAFFFII